MRTTDNPAYSSWQNMKARCLNPNSPSYPAYGGSGITVCGRWAQSFSAFLEDMGERPGGTSLDRFPNQRGNYEPGNCRWATPIQQLRNTKKNVIIEIGGEKKCASEWAHMVGLDASTVVSRIAHGWSATDAVFTPVRPLNQRGRPNSTGFRGVRKHRNKYTATIRKGNVPIFLGSRDTPEEASKLYRAALFELHGVVDASAVGSL